MWWISADGANSDFKVIINKFRIYSARGGLLVAPVQALARSNQ